MEPNGRRLLHTALAAAAAAVIVPLVQMAVRMVPAAAAREAATPAASRQWHHRHHLHGAVEFLEDALRLRQPEVLNPAAQQRGEGLDGAPDGSAAPLREQIPQLGPQPTHARRRHPKARLLVGRHGIAEKAPVPRAIDRASG